MSAAYAIVDEVGQSWRSLLRRPGYLALAVLTLALGVATVTLVFSLLQQALLSPLPFPQADRLVTLGIQIAPNQNIAAPRYYAPLQRMQTVESAGMLMGWTSNTNIAFGDRAEVVQALRVDRGFITTLGLDMAAGRNFDTEEDSPNGPQAAILSHAFWRTRLNADPLVIGTTLQIEGRAVEVVGVLPRSFQWPDPFELLLPLQPDPATGDLSTNQLVIARIAPDATIGSAAEETNAVLTSMLANDPGASERQREYLRRNPPTALPLKTSVFASRTGVALWLFFGAAACVLLIAAINLGSLMLLRSLTRSHDQSVRTALGASTARLNLPAFAEGALVGLLGSALGLLLAWIGLRVLGGMVPPQWLRGEAIEPGMSSVIFAALAGVATALTAAAMGLARGRGADWARELAGGGRGGWSRHAGRLGRALVVAQVAVAVVLLVGAALFTRSLQKLESIPMGFESHAVTTFTLAPVKSIYTDAENATEQTRRILDRLLQLPGVERAGASTNLPTGSQLNYSMVLPDEREINGQYRLNTPGFLEVFGIPLLTGRGFNDQDTRDSEPVCLISAEFAREYFSTDPLGEVIKLPMEGEPDISMRIVGVVGDVRQFGPGEPAPPILYTPLAQIPPSVWALLREFGPLSYAVRSRSDVGGADEAVLQSAIREIAPQQPISNLRSMEAIVDSTTSQQRLNLLLVGLFASLALLLASVGLYAVMAVAVTARRHEFGVRSALGVPPALLLRQVLREAGWQIGIGLAIGLVVAVAMARLLQSYLFQISTTDPVALAAVLLVLALAGLMASLMPAIRAARVQPLEASRTR